MEPSKDELLPWAERIAKLLRKAENTDNVDEAEAYTTKAQQLMVKYAITEELLARADGRQVQDVVVQESITYVGVFHRALFNIGWAIVRANDCRGFITKHTNDTKLLIIGFQTDVSNVKMLDVSLQIQASIAMQRWRSEEHTS